MGLVGQIRHPEVLDLTAEIGRRVMAAGLPVGTLILTQDDYSYWRERNFQIMITVAQTFFMNGANAMKGHSESFEQT